MPFVSASAISPYNDIRGGAEGGVAGTLLLDLYPGAAAAYSLRQLSTAYTGPAIQVRRSSDDTLQDIGFVDGNLDTASLLSFVGSGNGFVKTWYDQSGNSINAIQGTASKQPIIVSSGLVNTLNGKPTMQFISAFVMDLNLTQYPFTSGGSATEKSIFTIAENTASINQNLYNIADGRDIYAMTYNRSANNTYAFLGANYGVIGGNITGQNIISSLAISPSSKTFNNTVEGVSINLARANFNDISIGSRGGSYPMDGNIQEMVMYELNQSANRGGIEANANNYYSIYPTALDFNPYNIWDSEHISINNTTTTFKDFNTVGPTYDLVNPTATAQPVYTSPDSSFRGLPSITFDGVAEYVLGNAPNWRSSDTSGMFISVYRKISGSRLAALLGSNSTANNNYINWSVVLSNTYRNTNVTTSGNDSYRGSTNIQSDSETFVIANASTGSEYKMWVNENAETLTLVSGSLDGSKWFAAESSGYDQITIGALVRTNLAPINANIKWCMSGYFPYVDDATTESLITALKNKYIDAPIPVDPILAFNPTNVWDSEHVVINDDETTFVDFNNSGGGSYNLSNPAATNQPSFSQSSSNFNSLPSFTFDGVDNYVTASVSNFRGSDSSGVVINVVRIVGSNLIAGLGSYNTASSFNYIGYSVANVGNKVRIITAAPSAATANLRIYVGSTDVVAGNPPFAFANVSTGSEYKIFVDNAEDIVSVTNSPAGNDGAVWFNDGTQDNIAIGARNSSTIGGQGNIEWCFSGYFPYVSDSQVQGIMDYLVTKYNL